SEACDMLQALADKDFEGKVLPFAQRDSLVIGAVQERAEKLGIALLPPLLMPFSNEGLRESLATLLPEQSSGPLVDMAQAVGEGWLELWYQPKIDARALVMRGAEALLRVRHPAWGIVPPTYFAPDDDSRSGTVSDSVVRLAVEDWYRFFAQSGQVEIAINLPIAFLNDRESINCLCKQLPNHAAFEGLSSRSVDLNSCAIWIRRWRLRDGYVFARSPLRSTTPNRNGSRLPSYPTFPLSSSKSAGNLSPDA